MNDYLMNTILSLANLDEFENIELRKLIGSLEIKLNGKSIEREFGEHLQKLVSNDINKAKEKSKRIIDAVRDALEEE